MPTFATIMQDADERGLIRKVKRAVAFLAPLSVDLPPALTGSDSLPIDLKNLGYLPVGIVTPDGYRFGRDVEKDEVDALGYASFVRTDVMKVARTVAFNPLEFGRKHMSELRYGTDLSAVTPDAQSGEIVFDEPDMPNDAEYRLLIIADDGPASANWILGRGYGRVKLADAGEEAWGKEGAISSEITLDVFVDDELGVPVRHYLGGTGAKASADILGYAEPTPPAAWAATTVYMEGATASVSGGVLKAIQSGTSGGTEPAAPGIGSTVSDGSVEWIQIA